MFLLVRWQVSRLGIIGFVGASRLSLVIWKGLKSGVCGGCNPALRVQKKFETMFKKFFPMGGAGLGCQLCLCQGMAAKRASGGSGGYPGVFWPCWDSVVPWMPGYHLGMPAHSLSASSWL